MKKRYLKLNKDDKHLSLGNLFRIIKSLAINKRTSPQSEIFCILFNLDSISETTINNYCIGCRSINSNYKQIYLNYQKQYLKDKNVLIDTTINVLTLIEGNIITTTNPLNYINNNVLFKELCNKLYNISKNDNEVSEEYTDNIRNLFSNNNYYEAFCEFLFFIILKKKQPIYIDDLNQEITEKLLENTNISSKELEDFLLLKFRDSTNYYYGVTQLASNNNAYACYELGTQEYYGYISGTPRYDISFKYLDIAAKKGHAGANYLIANMILNKYLKSFLNDELKLAYDYLNTAIKHGSIEALNSIGLMYLNGIYPLKKDINKAIDYFNKAIKKDYVYAYNNLGKIYEAQKDYQKAFNYYLKSANLGESWASNKIGEYYRRGIIQKDLKKAFNYYNKALKCPKRNMCYYAKYNLAKYYYLCGLFDIEKNYNKALDYLKDASDHNIYEASIELLNIYTKKYWETNDIVYKNLITEIILKIENHPKYNSSTKKLIENNLLKEKERINRKIID